MTITMTSKICYHKNFFITTLSENRILNLRYIYSADVGAIIFYHDYFSNFRSSHLFPNTGVHNSQYMNS